MKYLIYLSTAVELFSDEQLEHLLDQSRRNNAERGVTGVLIYHEGSIIQVIEGEEADIDQLFAVIQVDLRHKNVTKIAEGENAQRIFSDWSMAFRRATSKQIAGFEPFRSPVNQKKHTDAADHPVLSIVKTFVRTNL